LSIDKGRPIAAAERGSATLSRTRRPNILSTRNAIFVVDDDPSMRMGVKRLLIEHGFNATLFDSGASLLSCADFSDAFCIILDIDLTDQSGIDLRRQLLNKDINLPVIFITGNDSDANRSAAIDSGCIAYLTKPFSARSLIEPIERAREAMS
jgi:FixJ family two-component response regulator